MRSSIYVMYPIFFVVHFIFFCICPRFYFLIIWTSCAFTSIEKYKNKKVEMRGGGGRGRYWNSESSSSWTIKLCGLYDIPVWLTFWAAPICAQRTLPVGDVHVLLQYKKIYEGKSGNWTRIPFTNKITVLCHCTTPINIITFNSAP